MSNPIQGPPAIFHMMQAGYVAAILHAGVRLNVFGAIDGGAHSAAAIGAKIGAPERPTKILLDALAVTGLVVTKGEGNYGLSELSSEHLVPGRQKYMGDMVGVFGDELTWSGLPRLHEAVQKGGSVIERPIESPEHKFWEGYATSIGAIATASAMALDALIGPWLEKRPKARILDVACGPGIYGYVLAKHPNVEATLLDWPNVLPHARKWGERMQADMSRVKFIEGDLFSVDWKGPYDFVLLSHVLHHFDRELCQTLANKAAAATAPGGRVAINEFVTDDGNPAGAMFSVVMLNTTRQGQAYSTKEYGAWLVEAGFANVAVHTSQVLPTSMLLGDKPA